MATPNPQVIQNNLSGTQLLWEDLGTYGTITDVVLTIYDYQGNVVITQDLGTALSYVFTITSDNWYYFSGSVTDGSGTYVTPYYYVSVGFYWTTYNQVYNASNCGCDNNNWNLVLSQLALFDALRANLIGLSGAAQAQRGIVSANYFVNNSNVIQLV